VTALDDQEWFNGRGLSLPHHGAHGTAGCLGGLGVLGAKRRQAPGSRPTPSLALTTPALATGLCPLWP
jgi:hypothetical protein